MEVAKEDILVEVHIKADILEEVHIKADILEEAHIKADILEEVHIKKQQPIIDNTILNHPFTYILHQLSLFIPTILKDIFKQKLLIVLQAIILVIMLTFLMVISVVLTRFPLTALLVISRVLIQFFLLAISLNMQLITLTVI
jgi:hypothetical protein